ncbi:MAG: nucleotide-binding protein containing -like protein domain-like protein [Frankiales bacterium]|nr:nucleotide-binding protein containing -like protein domain-like protein [Frankiales bacterium]
MQEGRSFREVEVATDAAVKDLERDVQRWRDKVRTWLDVSLGGEAADEFRALTTHYFMGGRLSPAQELHYLREAVASEVSKIESIMDRLDLWATSNQISGSSQLPGSSDAATIFIVHGADTVRAEQVARTVEKYTGRDAVILHLEPSSGKTIIEKLEANAAEAAFAVVILTPDDVGSRAQATSQLPRARQNVVFEMGFFFGHIGRAKTCVLYDVSVEKPSDVDGIVYVVLDAAEAWKGKLQSELKAAGLAKK